MNDEQGAEEQVEEQDPNAVVYFYHPQENPTNAFYPGIPLADLTQAQYDVLPQWAQAAVTGNDMYQAYPPEQEEPVEVVSEPVGEQSVAQPVTPVVDTSPFFVKPAKPARVPGAVLAEDVPVVGPVQEGSV